MENLESTKDPKSGFKRKIITFFLFLVVIAGAGTYGWISYDTYKCRGCDRAAQADAGKLSASLERLANELIDLNCPLAKWKITDAHLNSLVGPYYGFRGGTLKCDVRFRVQGDEIWVCAGKGTRVGNDQTRNIYRISADLATLNKDLPPITGPMGGRRYPSVAGGGELCFTESIVKVEDCSFRFGRKPRNTINEAEVRACQEKRAKNAGNQKDFQTLATNSVNMFSVDLYRKILREDQNLVFSPFTTYAVLAMGYGGAKGKTETEMAKALHADEASVPFHSTLGALTKDLDCAAASSNALFLTAIALVGNKTYGFTTEYQDFLRTNYNSEIKAIDFNNNPGQAMQEVNDWASRITQGKIAQLIQGVPDYAGLLTANAVYFNCAWAKEFSKSDTKDKEFFLLDGNRVMVPTMYTKAGFTYMENSTGQGLEIPYAGNEFSMVIFLPWKKDGLLKMERSLTGRDLSEWMNSLEPWPGGVIVYLPKFYLSGRFGLVETLRGMGMPHPFTRFEADFTGISGPRPPNERLFLADVIHQVGIDVSEEGTEAWAATIDCHAISGLDDGGPSGPMPPEPKIFRADHPFLFLIRHNASGCILFMGRVTEPQ